MNPVHHLANVPDFFAYLGCAFALTALYVAIYVTVTPHAEFRLIRSGNLSASIAFGGSLLGFVLPLGSTIAHSVSVIDLCLWGLIALVIQILAFFLMRLVLPTLPRDIESDKRGPAVFAAFVFLAVGILNASCLTW
ncbi:MAG: DUF350 domain-containing protein [Fibrobacterota bacterium]|nr:DUF350 domain-containing protein [Fibrobacterota bacterium]QQS07307.1 MAG: DUF350 domain-containing protein [Fibrobacterota bacterium]